MSESKQTYKLSTRPQLIDLNQNFKNFRLSFQAISVTDPEAPFQAVVLNQDQLDVSDLKNIAMKNAKGRIGGNIVADNDKYQNYFLLLKSENPLDVEVTISLQEIPPAAPVPETPPEKNFQTDEENTQITTNNNTSSQTPFWKKPIFWILVILTVAFLVYYFYQYIYIPYTLRKTVVLLPPDEEVPPPVLIEKTTETDSITRPQQQKKKNIYSQLKDIA